MLIMKTTKQQELVLNVANRNQKVLGEHKFGHFKEICHMLRRSCRLKTHYCERQIEEKT
jgi:hypothetical protein